MTNQLQHQPRRTDYRFPAIEKYAYCLCLHVKPTTIFIGVFILIKAIFATMLTNAEFSTMANDPSLSGTTNDLSLGGQLDERQKSTVAAMNLLTRTIMGSVSAVGIYGVISGRAALLMPLYAILLVDFFFALPAFYNRDLDTSFADSLADFKNHITGSNQYTRYSLMLFSTITMILKIYFLCVIWKCYRYLRLIELVSPIRLSEIYPHIHQAGGPHQYPIVRVLGSNDSTTLGSGHNIAPPPYESLASNMKPPNYDEAMKSSNMNFANVQQTNQQPNPAGQLQTVVFTNLPSERPQNISTQVITEQHVRLAMENLQNRINISGSDGDDLTGSCHSQMTPINDTSDAINCSSQQNEKTIDVESNSTNYRLSDNPDISTPDTEVASALGSTNLSTDAKLASNAATEGTIDAAIDIQKVDNNQTTHSDTN